MLRIDYTPRALKDMIGIGADAAAKVRRKVDAYAANPAAFANRVEKLQGRPGFRLRVGDYRVLFTEQGIVLSIIAVGHRREIYR